MPSTRSITAGTDASTELELAELRSALARDPHLARVVSSIVDELQMESRETPALGEEDSVDDRPSPTLYGHERPQPGARHYATRVENTRERTEDRSITSDESDDGTSDDGGLSVEDTPLLRDREGQRRSATYRGMLRKRAYFRPMTDVLRC